MPLGKWGTVAEAARHYGVTRQRIRQLIAKGGFAATRRIDMPRGPLWLIPYPFERIELPNGRPPKAGRRDSEATTDAGNRRPIA